MSGFRDHFLDKYFAFRSKYVEYVAEVAPRRRGWALASELARLSFTAFGSGLCALLFALLTVAAAQRGSFWGWVFGTCGSIAAYFLCAALVGAFQAARLLARQGGRRTDERG